MAVNVTVLLEQIEVDDALMDTDGVTALAVTAIALDVAVGVVVQFAFDVIITVTWSPLASELVINVEELVPAFTPFICH